MDDLNLFSAFRTVDELIERSEDAEVVAAWRFFLSRVKPTYGGSTPLVARAAARTFASNAEQFVETVTRGGVDERLLFRLVKANEALVEVWQQTRRCDAGRRAVVVHQGTPTARTTRRGNPVADEDQRPRCVECGELLNDEWECELCKLDVPF